MEGCELKAQLRSEDVFFILFFIFIRLRSSSALPTPFELPRGTLTRKMSICTVCVHIHVHTRKYVCFGVFVAG